MKAPRIVERWLRGMEERGEYEPAWGDREDVYSVALAGVLHQRTRRELAEPVLRELLRRYPEPSDLLKAPEDELKESLARIGLVERRLKAVLGLARLLSEDPEPSGEDLLSVPGVGPYTANLVRAVVYRERVLPVDANVRRVVRRSTGRPVGDVGAEWVRTARDPRDLALGTVELGRRCCRLEPECEECPIAGVCAEQGRVRG
ncbi:endonuclease III domain-containing protein [Methanopyrus kandleri]